MKKLWYSFTKELKLASKSFYFYIEFVMAFLIIFILLFLIPEEFNSRDDEYLVIDSPADVEEAYGVREKFLDAILEEDEDGQVEAVEMKLGKEVIEADLYVTEDANIYIIESVEDMEALTKKDRPKIGAHIFWDTEVGDYGAFVYDYYIQGYESDRLKNLYKIIHSKDLEVLVEMAEEIPIRALNTVEEPLNAREMALPSLMTFNGSLMGMFIIAAYIFIDKSEGIIKAYAVTASKVWQYLMSKAMVMTSVTIVTTLAIAVAVMGTRPNYLALIVLLITSSFAGSALGLLLSSFYDNMTKAFGVIYVFMMLFMMPAIAYFIPSWQPLWIKFIPTHYIIQGFKDIVINEGSMSFVYTSSAAFLAAGIIIFVIVNHRFKKNLAA